MPFSLNVSHSASSTLPRTLVRPCCGSWIQKRRTKSREDSPKSVSQQTGRRSASTLRDFHGGLYRQLADLVRVGIVGDTEIHVEPNKLVAERPIDDPLGDEILVGDQVFATVARHDRNKPRPQLADPAERAFKRDGVARLDRLVDKDDDAGDEIRDDLLQPKT